MATICMHHVLASMRPAVAAGIKQSDLLADAGINPSQLKLASNRIHTDQVARLFAAAASRLNDDLMGMGDRPLPSGAFQFAFESVMRSSFVIEGLERAAVFFRLAGAQVEMQNKSEGAMTWLGLHLNDPSRDVDGFMREWLLVIWHRFLCWLNAQALPLQQVKFAFAKPAHHGELDIMFHCPIEYDSPQSGFWLPSDYLQRPIQREQREFERFAARFPMDVMTIPGGKLTLESRISRLLRDRLLADELLPDLAELADNFGQTKQQLYRALKLENTSLQTLKNDVRREYAIRLLKNSDQSVDAIAERCGFDEARSFTRAFKDWTGLTPSAVRRGELK